MECLLGEKRWAVVSGSVISVAFVAFPWQLLVFGPIFPNLASFAALPAVMVLFVVFWQREMCIRDSRNGERVEGNALLNIKRVMDAPLSHRDVYKRQTPTSPPLEKTKSCSSALV